MVAALYVQRRLHADHTGEFLGRTWPVTPTPRKTVTLVHHPEQRFWKVPPRPDPQPPIWPDMLAHHRL